jgi:Flagellar biosynthesis protein, FliO
VTRTALPALLWGFVVLPMTSWAEAGAETPLSRLPLQHDPDPGWGGIGMLQLALAGIVLAVWIGWLAWRRKGLSGMFRPAQRDGLKVLQSTALTARASLHVVRWDGREWLLGCTERGITPLAERTPPDTQAPARGEA